jgi:hypothetical protein
MRKLVILLFAATLVVAFTLPAAAADWGFYGHARMLTFQTNQEQGDWDDSDLGWNLSGSGRVGANVKAGDITGQVEYANTTIYDGNSIQMRLMYGTWNFGAGSLSVGQKYGPVNFFPSNMAYGDNSMVSYGAPYGGRVPQIELALMGGALKIAALQPKTTGATGDVDTTLPKIEVAFGFPAGPATLYLFGGMNTVDSEDGDSSVDSNVFGVGFKIPIGPLYVNGDVYMATNPGNYGLASASALSTVSGDEDADNMIAAVVVGYKISDMLKFEAGFGYMDGEQGDLENTKTFMYAQLPITLAKNVWITPEIGFLDKGELNDVEQGEMNYFGAKWEIRF